MSDRKFNDQTFLKFATNNRFIEMQKVIIEK